MSSKRTELVGLNLVVLQTNLLGEQFAGIGEHTEDADATGKGCRFGDNPVGWCADVVAARCSHSTHRDNDRFLFLHLHKSVPDLFGSVSATTTGVDAHDDSLHIVVVHQFLQILANHLCVNLVFLIAKAAASSSIYDVAVGVVNGNLFTLFRLVLDILHVVDAELVDAFVVLYLQQLLHLGLHLVGIEQCVNQFQLQHVFGVVESNQTVSIRVQLFDAEFTTGGNIFGDVLPNAVDIGFCLFAVGIAHLVAGENLDSALVGTHLCYLHLHADFCQHVLEVNLLGCQTMPVEHTLRVQPHLVGSRSQIVGALCVGVSVSNNPFATFLEVGQSTSDSLHRRIRVGSESPSFDIDALDFLIILSFLNGRENVV